MESLLLQHPSCGCATYLPLTLPRPIINNQNTFLNFSRRKSLIVRAKKKKSNNKEDNHNFFKSDDSELFFPEAVLLKEVFSSNSLLVFIGFRFPYPGSQNHVLELCVKWELGLLYCCEEFCLFACNRVFGWFWEVGWCCFGLQKKVQEDGRLLPEFADAEEGKWL